MAIINDYSKKKGGVDVSKSNEQLDEKRLITYAEMRQIALGCLMFTPERFAALRLGDWLDTLIGYLESEVRQTRHLTETIRHATTLIYSRWSEKPILPDQLWPLPWDGSDNQLPPELSEEEAEAQARYQEMHKEMLKNM